MDRYRTAFLIAITATVWRYRRKGWLFTGWRWFVVTLIPEEPHRLLGGGTIEYRQGSNGCRA